MHEASRGRFWRRSPLTRRIFAVNVAALLLLVLGLLYTGQFERGLIDSELEALAARGALVSAALAEGGTRPTDAGDPRLAEDLARDMLRRLVAQDDARVVVFDRAGGVLLDSRQMMGPGGLVEIEPLAESSGRSFSQLARRFFDGAFALLPTRLRLPPLDGGMGRGAQDYPGALPALEGGFASGAWRAPDGRIVLTAALPVQSLRHVIGAVFLARDGKGVDNAVRGIQATVLKVFLVALLVTVLLSVYLAETVVEPIVRLARATEKVRESILMKDEIPDFSYRGDEIGDLSRAFRDMTRALSDRIEAISRFAADVAHEIKNPLASVKSAVETFPLAKDEAQRQKLLAVIHHDINRMNRLITDISNASRLDSELSVAPRAPLDLAALLKDVVSAEGDRIGDSSRIALLLEEGRRLPVTGNPVQLAQVMHNLIDNALSFVTADGKVTVSAGFREGRIYVHVDNPGPAIPESKLEAIFERFYSERPGGEAFGLHSGLGLSISRQIARQHRGEVSAQNLKDRSGTARGVRFTMILPAGAGTK